MPSRRPRPGCGSPTMPPRPRPIFGADCRRPCRPRSPPVAPGRTFRGLCRRLGVPTRDAPSERPISASFAARSARASRLTSGPGAAPTPIAAARFSLAPRPMAYSRLRSSSKNSPTAGPIFAKTASRRAWRPRCTPLAVSNRADRACSRTTSRASLMGFFTASHRAASALNSSLSRFNSASFSTTTWLQPGLANRAASARSASVLRAVAWTRAISASTASNSRRKSPNLARPGRSAQAARTPSAIGSSHNRSIASRTPADAPAPLNDSCTRTCVPTWDTPIASGSIRHSAIVFLRGSFGGGRQQAGGPQVGRQLGRSPSATPAPGPLGSGRAAAWPGTGVGGPPSVRSGPPAPHAQTPSLRDRAHQGSSVVGRMTTYPGTPSGFKRRRTWVPGLKARPRSHQGPRPSPGSPRSTAAVRRAP